MASRTISRTGNAIGVLPIFNDMRVESGPDRSAYLSGPNELRVLYLYKKMFHPIAEKAADRL
ncbi:hypothetical protein KTH_57160 [Thermosporothrix hazakensis]|jgi:hypothetical protein|nr:hypothetical protein KTH_57160 [Thermosporothrix hazakensis]